MRAFVLHGRGRNSCSNLKGCALVSHENELTDLDVDILIHLHLRHLAKDRKSRNVTNPTDLLTRLKTSPVKRDHEDLPLSSYLRTFRADHGVTVKDVAAVLTVPVE